MSEPGLRDRKKAATRRSIQEHALRLFLAKGYDATTVAEIAAAAGVSSMTFFRYFPTKEDVVEYDDYDPRLAGAVAARPAGESGLQSIGAALGTALSTLDRGELETVHVRTRLVFGTPALRARVFGNQEATRSMLASALAARETPTARADFRHRVVAGAALGVIETVLAAWAAADDPAALATLMSEAFAEAAADTGTGT